MPHAFVIDPRLSFIEGATIPANYGTTFRMLFTNGDMQPNDLVLVLGASGGVGTATVGQVAKAHGGRVIACAGSDENARLKELGADDTINYIRTISRERPGASAARKGSTSASILPAGIPGTLPSARSSRTASCSTCGATAGFDARTDIRYIWQREVKICGSNGYTKEDVTAGMVAMAEGRIKKPSIRTFPLAQLGEAEAVMEARDFFGKIVMIT